MSNESKRMAGRALAAGSTIADESSSSGRHHQGLKWQLGAMDYHQGKALLEQMARRGAAPLGPLSQYGIDTQELVNPDSNEAKALAEEGLRGKQSEVPHRSKMEAAFGRDFSGVTAHTGASTTAACDALNAEAFTVGNRIAFRDATPNQETVAHELAHTLQQDETHCQRVQCRGPHSKGSEEEVAEQAAKLAAAGKLPGNLQAEGAEASNPACPHEHRPQRATFRDREREIRRAHRDIMRKRKVAVEAVKAKAGGSAAQPPFIEGLMGLVLQTCITAVAGALAGHLSANISSPRVEMAVEDVVKLLFRTSVRPLGDIFSDREVRSAQLEEMFFVALTRALGNIQTEEEGILNRIIYQIECSAEDPTPEAQKVVQALRPLRAIAEQRQLQETADAWVTYVALATAHDQRGSGEPALDGVLDIQLLVSNSVDPMMEKSRTADDPHITLKAMRLRGISPEIVDDYLKDRSIRDIKIPRRVRGRVYCPTSRWGLLDGWLCIDVAPGGAIVDQSDDAARNWLKVYGRGGPFEQVSCVDDELLHRPPFWAERVLGEWHRKLEANQITPRAYLKRMIRYYKAVKRDRSLRGGELLRLEGGLRQAVSCLNRIETLSAEGHPADWDDTYRQQGVDKLMGLVGRLRPELKAMSWLQKVTGGGA